MTSMVAALLTVIHSNVTRIFLVFIPVQQRPLQQSLFFSQLSSPKLCHDKMPNGGHVVVSGWWGNLTQSWS